MLTESKKKLITETAEKLKHLSESQNPKDHDILIRVLGVVQGIMIGAGIND